jgi:putative ABC transport system permease protein
MTLKEIAINNLRRRKAKAAFVFFGLLIGISSVVAFFSLVGALTQDINHKLEKYGANILIVPKTENLSLSYGGLSLGGISFEMQEIKQEELSNIRNIKNTANVAAVGPMVLGPVNTRNHAVLLAGIDFESSPFLRPWWKVRGANPIHEEILAGYEAARILDLKVGEALQIEGRRLRIAGVLEATGSQDDQILFTHLGTAQALLNKEGKISLAEVAALCAGCPIEDMVRQISEVLPSAKVMAIKQVVKGRMETLGHFEKFAYGLSAVIMLVGGLVVLVTMLGSVRERISEFGIFRAIGFQRRHVMGIVLFEAALISAVAGLFGYLLGLGATKTFIPLFTDSQTITVPIDPIFAGIVLFLAMCLGLVSSAYPSLMAARLDPNDALRTL